MRLVTSLRFKAFERLLPMVRIGMGMLFLVACNSKRQSLDSQFNEFKLVKGQLEAIDSIMRSGSGIFEMDDGQRSFGRLNGVLVMPRTYAGDSVVKGPFVTRYPVHVVLAREGVSARTYDSLRSRLSGAGIGYVRTNPSYTVFIVGGSLDNFNGYLLLQHRGRPPEIGDLIGDGRLVFIKAFAAEWFYITTS